MTLYEIAAQLREIQAELDEKHYVTNNNGDTDYKLTAAVRLGVADDAARRIGVLKAEVVKLASESKEPQPSPGEEP
jgi:hypothetical protein